MSRQHEVEVLELARGGLVIYPTETFYALGCLATVHSAVEKIFSAKGRPSDKPLPLIVSDWEMAERFLRLTKAEEELARKFWPGPLSIVAEVDPRVSSFAKDHAGRAAVRMSPHVVAARLCREAGAPLVSSSANLSGRPPVCRPDELDSELVRDSGALVIASTPWPGGGLPSTLVKIVGTNSLRILRAGAISAEEIIAAGFEVLS